MIIVTEAVKGNSGKGVPMFSRSGKQTINQFLSFAAKKKRVIEEPVDEMEMISGIDQEFREIIAREEEIKKQKETEAIQQRNKMKSNSPTKMDKSQGSYSFKVTSRVRHEEAFKNRTNPPDLGKYNINFADSHQRAVKMLNESEANTRPRKRDHEKLNQIDHLCDRLLRSTQHRDNRVEVINSLYRKKQDHYRFNEATMKSQISQLIDDSPKARINRLESTIQDTSFDKLENTGSLSKRSSVNNRKVTISPNKMKTPGRKTNFALDSPEKNSNLRKTISQIKKANSQMKNNASRLSNTLNGSFNLSTESLIRRKYGYKSYALGDEYHIVKNNKNQSLTSAKGLKFNHSVEKRGNFEIIPNISKPFEGHNHVQSINFHRSPDRNLDKKIHFKSTMSKKKKLREILKNRTTKISPFKGTFGSMILSQTEVPEVMKKHVPSFQIGKQTSRKELW
ncbi:unnamed protein product [Moneuplotes crassus]|uniref:Uncharacterized protein n=1 Tax=Euplotes crassus TaxID=5936 RepID=A0AAD1X7U2_EUPCR|nr:unnamed protein product [Moneuplotes crassus]